MYIKRLFNPLKVLWLRDLMKHYMLTVFDKKNQLVL